MRQPRDTGARHKLWFAAMSPPQPWPCHFCGKPVTVTLYADGRGMFKDTLVIHHLDENPFNNDFENLAPSHGGCHTTHHRKGKPTGLHHSEEHKAKIRASMLSSGHRPPPPKRGPMSQETRDKISAGVRAARAKQ